MMTSITPSHASLKVKRTHRANNPPPVPAPTASTQPVPTPPKRPNILLILADDVGTEDVPAYWGNNIVAMPNVAKLSSMGVTFLDAHASPLCAPSRYMLLSGNYQHRGSVLPSAWNFWDGENQFQPGQQSIAQVLKRDAGYHTMMVGKYHVGAKLPAGGKYNKKQVLKGKGDGIDWRKPVTDGPNDLGFESTYYTIAGIQEGPYSFFRDGYLETAISDVVTWPAGDYDMPRGRSSIKSECDGDKDWDSTAYNMKLVNETNAFLDNHLKTRKDDPFFAYVALGAVHLPHSPPDTYLDGTPVAGEYYNAHLDMLLEMDKVVGSLVDAVEKRGLQEETIIIFTSDNGGLGSFNYPDRVLRGHKGDIWEGGHRIPMIIRYDGTFPKGENRTSHFVGLNDIYATLTEIADVPIPDRSAQDSVSFAKYIESEDNVSGLRKYFGVWDYIRGENGQDLHSESLRYGDLKVVRHFSPDLKTELYNLTEDLAETRNIEGFRIHQAVINEMLAEVNKIGPCPDDEEGSFVLTSGNDKGNTVNCEWFAKPNEYRCKYYIDGELNCNSICGRHSLCGRVQELYKGQQTAAEVD